MRITLENFKDHVTPYQLRKGQDYFDKGRVSKLQRSATGRWTAIVKGREEYTVRFETSGGGEIREVYCDCIAQEGDGFCKHVLAMLIAIEKQGPAATLGGAAKIVPINSYEGETRMMVETLRSEMLEGNFQPAANKVLAMIKSMPMGPDRDDFEVDDDVYDRVKWGFKLMAELAQSGASQELKDRMYKRSLETAFDPRWSPWSFDPHWMDVLVILSKGKEEEVLGVVDRLLAEATDFHKSFDRHVFRFLNLKIKLLRALGREEQAFRLVEGYPLLKELRESLIRDYEEAGDFRMIKALAEHGIQTAFPTEPRLQRHWLVVLQNMAVKFNDPETERACAEQLAAIDKKK